MRSMNRQRGEAGFSLIEVLISMFVISVGLLGVLSIFLKGITTTDAAYLRSQAVVFAHDLADRIRANPSALDNYSLAAATTVSAPVNDCYAEACSTLQLAEADVYDWKSHVESVLPQGDASIVTVDPNTTITITWDHMGDSETYSLVMR